MSFSSKIFSIDTVKMSDRSEQIVKGGRHLFPLLPQGVRGRQADRRHRLGLAGAGAGAEPARLAGGDRHQGQGRPARRAARPWPRPARRASPRRTARSARCSRSSRSRTSSLLLISDAAQGELYAQGVREPAAGRDAGPVARLPARPPQERRREAARQHQRHRASARRAWDRRCAGCTCRARRSTAPASTPASPSTRTSTAARPTTRSAGRWRSARPTRSRRRWSPSTSRTSTASAASCSAPCTA